MFFGKDRRPSVVAGDVRACDRFDIKGELDQVQIPTLIMVGDEDKMTPIRFSEELAKEINNPDLEVIQGAGHMLPLEQPEVVAKKVRGFMERVLNP